MNAFALQRRLAGLLTAVILTLAIYAELIGRQPVNTGVPSVSISLRSQIPLTRAEALYALDATAALNHLRFVGAGDQQVTLEAAPTDRKDAATPPK